eukprot:754656-Hanusia_phi.AAC.6
MFPHQGYRDSPSHDICVTLTEVLQHYRLLLFPHCTTVFSDAQPWFHLNFLRYGVTYDPRKISFIPPLLWAHVIVLKTNAQHTSPPSLPSPPPPPQPSPPLQPVSMSERLCP